MRLVAAVRRNAHVVGDRGLLNRDGARAPLARLDLQVLFEETLTRFPRMELVGAPVMIKSVFINQLKTLPVELKAIAPFAGPGSGLINGGRSPD